MNRHCSSACLFFYNSLPFVFFLLIICYADLFVKVEAGCTSSCGKLQNISYPFRLRDDPKHCGEADYELICEDGEALFYVGAHKYSVTQINYPINSDDYFGSSITLHVSCPFTRNTCPLPYNSYSNFIYNGRFSRYSWATFIHCWEKIETSMPCVFDRLCIFPAPSLIDENKTSYIVLGYRANELFALPKSCMFVDTILFADFYFIDSSKLVIAALQEVFTILWQDPSSTNCWNYALSEANEHTKGFFHFQRALYPFYFVVYLFGCLSPETCGYLSNGNRYKCQIIYDIFIPIAVNVLVFLIELATFCKFILPTLSMCAYLLYNCWRNIKPLDSVEFFLQMQKVHLPRRYTYGEIMVMTKFFKEKLGRGGFGQVYKGELFAGYLVAVKVLEGLQFNGEDFINEVSTIGMIHHVNVVQLVGFCSEGNKRALIYEYMPNGSLDRSIFSSHGANTRVSLALEKLNSIALGIAKGINYLHTGCDVQILHFDIKPQNVLLDVNFIPKISDFGLAKLYPREQNLVSVSAARGTIGYIAPELISRSFGVISQKSDVYSFGMLILEMAGRRRNFDTRIQDSMEVYYPSWIYDQLCELKGSNIDEITGIEELEKRLCKVGLWCIQMNSSHRPTMSQVVKLLESNVDDIEMPPKPFLFSTTEAHTCNRSSTSALHDIVEDDNLSENDLV